MYDYTINVAQFGKHCFRVVKECERKAIVLGLVADMKNRFPSMDGFEVSVTRRTCMMENVDVMDQIGVDE